MITNNGAQILSKVRVGSRATQDCTLYDEDGNIFTTLAQAQDAYSRCTKNNTTRTVSSSSYSGTTMIVGLGDTAENVNDYWLEETEIEGVDVNTIVTLQSAQNTWLPTITSSGKMVFTFSFRNEGSTSITIKEIGLLYVNTNGRILLARRTITPRVVSPNETVTFNYEIGCN